MRKTSSLATAIFLLLLSMAYPLYAEQSLSGPEKTAARLQAKIDTIRSLSFQFYQQTRGSSRDAPEKDPAGLFF
ncbi:hypothetical protein DGMP_05970 [Desulfomarina profundi]|uniref:Outer membrane lipoprotein carrier protein LolA n=1 Tax=Desulfomarina profundi TaxID=2772557 RepID=A0A8D5FQG1_9BACT|nr:hypothetical protein [Desulfomarina profundi]BCL59904.1 hypothetical protein DGMP_05970 [Desulfomarina profundi]